MKRVLLITFFMLLLYPIPSFAENDKDVKAAFIRDGNLWTFINNKEKQITTTGRVFGQPKWSKDGQWLLYRNEALAEHKDNEFQHEIWAYKIQTGEKKKIFYDGNDPSWSPKKNIIAFNQEGILNISDFTRFYNIATGVHGYTWLPDGNGFLLSAAGTLRPDGWTSAILFLKKVGDNYKDVVLFDGVDHFFTLPREIGTNKNNKIIAVYVYDLNYSPSRKWISFIVSPTASCSMDSNMLCVISSDGKNFKVLDELILQVGQPKWAPSNDTIAYIAGGGRIVFGFKNKDLKIEVCLHQQNSHQKTTLILISIGLLTTQLFRQEARKQNGPMILANIRYLPFISLILRQINNKKSQNRLKDMVITSLYTLSRLIRLFGLEKPPLQITSETFGGQILMGQKQNYG
ncbi:hypothetical protein [Bacillus sp. ISL-46]|uniref:TolB family protein n=1 Tax=Bacillus sp. ISL-46 TaxID=2819129 RepID=UPI002034DC1E|nr:hypothetical protein [Bacillus sp. ISL-46]